MQTIDYFVNRKTMNTETMALPLIAKENRVRGGKRVSGQRGGEMARRRYQMGSLSQRGKRMKVWVLRWREDVIDSNEQTRRVRRETVLGAITELPTRKLARRRADVLLSRVNRADYRPGKIIGFEEFSERWKKHVLSQQKPSSQKASESHLRSHLVPSFKHLRIDQIGQEDVQRFVAQINGLSRHTILNVLATLCSMLRMARQWGYVANEIRSSELAIPNNKPAKIGRYLTVNQAMQVLARATENPWRTIFHVAAFAGMRPGEVLGLSIDDLNFDEREIHIHQSGWFSRLVTPKTKKSIGCVYMPDALEKVLREYLQSWAPNPRRLLFANSVGNPHSANNIVQRRLWPILDELKIPRCGMHAFRHGLATALASRRVSPNIIQQQLRHSSPLTTMGMYVHAISQDHRDAVEEYASVLDGYGRNKAVN